MIDAGQSQSPTAEPRDDGVEIGLRIGAGQTAEAREDGPTSQVHRLEATETAEPLRARSMSDLGPAAPYVPRRRRKQWSLAQLTMWMAVGTCTLAIAAVAWVMVERMKQSQRPEPTIAFVPEVTFGEEKAYFLEHTGTLAREAESLLESYVAAKSPADVLPLVRDAARVEERLNALWQPMGSISKSMPVDALLHDSEVRPALLLKGTKADFSPFRMVFVRQDGQLKLDWEASYGIGDAQLAELRGAKSVVKGAKVRVMVQPGGFYTPEFPESEYRSYQLLDVSREDFVWAFVRRTSGTAELLEAEFNEGSVLLEKTGQIPATLRISGPLREGVHLFEITEMLHKGWVSP